MNKKKILSLLILGMLFISFAFVTADEKVKEKVKELTIKEKLKLKTDSELKTELQNSFNETHCKYDEEDKREYCYADYLIYEKIKGQIYNKTISLRSVINDESVLKCQELHSDSTCITYLSGNGFNYTNEENQTIHIKGKQEQFDSKAQRYYELSKKNKEDKTRKLNLTKVNSVSLNG